MENAKQKAIEVAYGIYWEKVKDLVDENGWMTVTDLLRSRFPLCKLIECECDDIEYIQAYRPKLLSGIETNNNWISIHSDDDLPNEEGSYFTLTNYSDDIIERDYPIFTKSMSIDDDRKWWLENITHYQPIIKPEKPIY